MSLRRHLQQHWMVVAMVAAALVAQRAPAAGAALYHRYSKGLIACIFLLLGLSLPQDATHKAVKRIAVHARCQALSLVAVPGAYYAVVHRRGLDAAVLGPAVARGLMVCLCMPTTTTTGVVFTEGAGGDASVAAVNAALGNLLGPVVSPATVAFLVGTSPASAGEAPLAAKIGALFLVIVLPFATGGVAQTKLGRAAPRVRAAAAKATKVVLCFLFYFLFCTVFAPFGPSFDPATLAALAAFVLATHVVLLALCWAACRDLAVQDRIAVSLMASQKTESKAAALLTVLYGDSRDLGELLLPVVAYHSVQMVVAAALAAPMRAAALRGPPKPGDVESVGGGAA